LLAVAFLAGSAAVLYNSWHSDILQILTWLGYSGGFSVAMGGFGFGGKRLRELTSAHREDGVLKTALYDLRDLLPRGGESAVFPILVRFYENPTISRDEAMHEIAPHLKLLLAPHIRVQVDEVLKRVEKNRWQLSQNSAALSLPRFTIPLSLPEQAMLQWIKRPHSPAIQELIRSAQQEITTLTLTQKVQALKARITHNGEITNGLLTAQGLQDLLSNKCSVLEPRIAATYETALEHKDPQAINKLSEAIWIWELVAQLSQEFPLETRNHGDVAGWLRRLFNENRNDLRGGSAAFRALTPEEKEILNSVAFDPKSEPVILDVDEIKLHNPELAKRILSVHFYEDKRLAALDDVLLSHAGIGGEIFRSADPKDADYKAVYMSPAGKRLLEGLSPQAKIQYYKHEIEGHLDHPDWDEEQVLNRFPLDRVFLEAAYVLVDHAHSDFEEAARILRDESHYLAIDRYTAVSTELKRIASHLVGLAANRVIRQKGVTEELRQFWKTAIRRLPDNNASRSKIIEAAKLIQATPAAAADAALARVYGKNPVPLSYPELTADLRRRMRDTEPTRPPPFELGNSFEEPDIVPPADSLEGEPAMILVRSILNMQLAQAEANGQTRRTTMVRRWQKDSHPEPRKLSLFTGLIGEKRGPDTELLGNAYKNNAKAKALVRLLAGLRQASEIERTNGTIRLKSSPAFADAMQLFFISEQKSATQQALEASSEMKLIRYLVGQRQLIRPAPAPPNDQEKRVARNGSKDPFLQAKHQEARVLLLAFDLLSRDQFERFALPRLPELAAQIRRPDLTREQWVKALQKHFDMRTKDWAAIYKRLGLANNGVTTQSVPKTITKTRIVATIGDMDALRDYTRVIKRVHDLFADPMESVVQKLLQRVGAHDLRGYFFYRFVNGIVDAYGPQIDRIVVINEHERPVIVRLLRENAKTLSFRQVQPMDWEMMNEPVQIGQELPTWDSANSVVFDRRNGPNYLEKAKQYIRSNVGTAHLHEDSYPATAQAGFGAALSYLLTAWLSASALLPTGFISSQRITALSLLAAVLVFSWSTVYNRRRLEGLRRLSSAA
jgi:hypothetical protein